MPDAVPFDVLLGRRDATHVRLEVMGFVHPEVAEPHGFDLLACRVRAHAEPVEATFAFSLRVIELVELRAYLAEINSGNGPPASFAMSGGLLNLSFAPSRRGPVLCAVMLKSIDASHARLEFMLTMEPEDISAALDGLAGLPGSS
ncbi:MAG TPA: hypothetical protein VFE36_16820 [Candidatus Baltobacteraceae bacterium]|jgi:hypothetical protein|nr:hypothetical protein [Candidatus Baltobacteraceae bacterium]